MNLFPKLNLLFSYAHTRKSKTMTDVILGLCPYVDFLIDSGAFTNHADSIKAAASGKKWSPITVEEYIHAARRFDGNVWQYIMLDKLNDPTTSRANLNKMLDAGLLPMPVFVRGDEYPYAEELTQINPYICVGGVVDAKVEYGEQRLMKVYEASGRRAKIHALGFVRFPSIFQVPIFSCDSSSIAAGQQYGTVTLFDPQKGISGKKWWYMGAPGKFTQSTMNHLLDCNVDPETFYNPDYHRGGLGVPGLVTVNAHLNFLKYTADRDRKYFFATTNLGLLASVLAVLQAKTGLAFDYKRAVRYVLDFKAVMAERNPGRIVDEAVSVLGAFTKC